MKEIVSVIVPVYNVEKYVRECIESLIHQTYKELEIILINDGSKDNSLDICKEYEKKDNRIKVIDKENQGVSVTRNLGIKKSNGKYIMFIDADDYIEKDTILNMVSAIQKNNSDIVLSKVKLLENGTFKETYSYYNEDIEIKDEIKKELISSLFYDNKNSKFSYVGGPFAKLISKEFIINNQIDFYTNLIYGEDLIFSLLLYINSESIYFLNQSNYIYRQNENSTMNKFNINIIKYYINLINNISDIFEKNNLKYEYGKEFNYFILKQIDKFLEFYFFRKENPQKYSELKKEYFDLIKKDEFNFALKNVEKEKLNSIRRMIVFCSKYKLYLLLKIYYKIFFLLIEIKRKIFRR